MAKATVDMAKATVKPTLPPVLTFPEGADFLRISERKLSDMVKAGEVPYFRVGKQIRFNTAQLEQWTRQ